MFTFLETVRLKKNQRPYSFLSQTDEFHADLLRQPPYTGKVSVELEAIEGVEKCAACDAPILPDEESIELEDVKIHDLQYCREEVNRDIRDEIETREGALR